MAIPDVLVTLRFRLVVEILLWNCGLRLKVYSTFVAYLYSFAFFFFFFLPSGYWDQYDFGEFQYRRHRARTIFFTYLSCDRELNSPKLYRCRSLISFEKHFAFRYSPKSAIARACLVSRRIIRSQRVPTRDSRSHLDRSRDFSARVVGFLKTYREKLEQKEASGIKWSTIKNVIYRRNMSLPSKRISP